MTVNKTLLRVSDLVTDGPCSVICTNTEVPPELQFLMGKSMPVEDMTVFLSMTQ